MGLMSTLIAMESVLIFSRYFNHVLKLCTGFLMSQILPLLWKVVSAFLSITKTHFPITLIKLNSVIAKRKSIFNSTICFLENIHRFCCALVNVYIIIVLTIYYHVTDFPFTRIFVISNIIDLIIACILPQANYFR